MSLWDDLIDQGGDLLSDAGSSLYTGLTEKIDQEVDRGFNIDNDENQIVINEPGYEPKYQGDTPTGRVTSAPNFLADNSTMLLMAGGAALLVVVALVATR